MNEESPAIEETKALVNLLESLLRDSDDRPAEGFLTGFVAVVEWMKPDGTFCFWRYNGDATGSALPLWRINGMLEYGKGSEFVGEDDE